MNIYKDGELIGAVTHFVAREVPGESRPIRAGGFSWTAKLSDVQVNWQKLEKAIEPKYYDSASLCRQLGIQPPKAA